MQCTRIHRLLSAGRERASSALAFLRERASSAVAFLREGFLVDTKEPLARHELVLRNLSWALVAAYLALALLPDSVTLAAGYVFFASGYQLLRLPIFVILASAFGLALGWPIILTGAIYCRTWALLPLMALFALSMYILGLRMSDVTVVDALTNPRSILGMLVIVAVMAAHLLARRHPTRREHPLTIFGAGVVILLAFLYQPSFVELAGKLYLTFFPIMQLLSIFWLISALALTEAAVRAGRWVGGVLYRRLSPPAFTRVVALLIALLSCAGLLMWVQRTVIWFAALAWYFVGFSLITLVMLLLKALRRWSAPNAQVLFAASLFIPAWVLALGGYDLTSPVATFLAQARLVPINLVYVGLMIITILGVTPSFVDTKGRVGPRPARVLLLLGAVLLTTSAVLLDLHTADARLAEPYQSDRLTSSLLPAGALVLGLPYLFWLIVWRPSRLRPQEMVSGAAQNRPAAAGLPRSVGRAVAASTALALLGVMFGWLVLVNALLVAQGSGGFLPQALKAVPSLSAPPAAPGPAPAGGPRLASSEETLRLRSRGEVVAIRNVTSPQAPLTLYMDVPLLVESGWCAASQSILEDNFKHYRATLLVNDQPVGPAQVSVLDERKRGPTGYCRSASMVVSGWPPGPTRVSVTTQIDAPINDGLSDFPPGSTTRTYTVVRMAP